MLRRPFIFLLVAIGLVAALTLPSGRAAPVPAFRLEALLPAKTLAFVSLEGIGDWKAKFEQTAIYKMWMDPEVQAFANPLIKDAKKMLEPPADGANDPKDPNTHRGGPQVPPVVGKLIEQLKNLHGQAAVAVLDWKKRGGPVLAGGMDFGEHVSDFTAFLKKVQEEMSGKDFTIKTSERSGRTFWEIGEAAAPAVEEPKPPNPPNPDDPKDSNPPFEAKRPHHGDMHIVATTIGSAFLMSTEWEWLYAAADANGAPVPNSLSDLPEFKGVRENAGGAGTAFFVFANVPEIVSLADPSEKDRKMMNALGVDTIKGAGYGLAFKGDGFLDTIIVQAPGADHGILPLYQSRPMTHAALPLVPASAFFFEEWTPGISTMLPKIRKIAADVDPESSAKIDKAMGKVRETTGVDVETELLPAFSDDFAVYAGLPETGGLYPEVAVILGVKDPAAFEPVFEKAVNGLSGYVSEAEHIKMYQRTIEYRGKKLHVVDLDAQRGKGVIPFTPTWTMIKDRLVVTLVPHSMKEIVLRSEIEGAGGLAGQEDFQSLLRVAPEGTGAMSYIDTQALMALLYDTVVPTLESAVKPSLFGDSFHIDWAQLPAARTMRPYFRSMAGFGTVDAQGMRVSIHSPFGYLPIVAAAGAVFWMTFAEMDHRISATMPEPRGGMPPDITFPPSVDEAARASMQANVTLEKVAINLVIFRAKEGHLPDTLEELVTSAKLMDAVPADPWKNELRYRVLDAKEGTAELRSAGPNGVFGDEDDVVKGIVAAK